MRSKVGRIGTFQGKTERSAVKWVVRPDAPAFARQLKLCAGLRGGNITSVHEGESSKTGRSMNRLAIYVYRGKSWAVLWRVSLRLIPD